MYAVVCAARGVRAIAKVQHVIICKMNFSSLYNKEKKNNSKENGVTISVGEKTFRAGEFEYVSLFLQCRRSCEMKSFKPRCFRFREGSIVLWFLNRSEFRCTLNITQSTIPNHYVPKFLCALNVFNRNLFLYLSCVCSILFVLCANTSYRPYCSSSTTPPPLPLPQWFGPCEDTLLHSVI